MLGGLGSAQAGHDHIDHMARERVIERLVTVQQPVVCGAIEEVQGDLGVGAGGQLPAVDGPAQHDPVLCAQR